MPPVKGTPEGPPGAVQFSHTLPKSERPPGGRYRVDMAPHVSRLILSTDEKEHIMARTRANSGKVVLARKSVKGNVVTVRWVTPTGKYPVAERG